MRHPNGFYYHRNVLLRCDTIRDLQWRLRRKAEEREPRLLEMAEIPARGSIPDCCNTTVYLGGPTAWIRANPELVKQVEAQIIERCQCIWPRLQRCYAWMAERNVEYVATLSPEQARAAFELYHETGLNGGSWGCLYWYEVLPPGVTHQAAANALEEGFTVDHGWQREGEWSVRRHSAFTPGAAKPSKTAMHAKRI